MPNQVLDERTIFLRAVVMTAPGQRTSFLDSACRGNRLLRQGVEALLRAHEDSFGLLDAPDRGLPTLDRAPISHGPGEFIGPYRLLSVIGEGGMGAVWLAEQDHPVRRKVALKIIKPGMDTRKVIARFEAERQVLAMMDHPNIAKVFDAGTTENGRPYFAMELVSGVPITRYCDDHKLTLRQRLELLLPVCHAVQHAHQKGIIHRDLKPSNVLVATYDAPVPTIIDFGVSKATGRRLTEQTTVTQCGLLVGTLEYMSPEQASFRAQDIDTRSDIYALGVLAYELITGSTPFEKHRLYGIAFDEVLQIIRQEEPPRPSTRVLELSRAAVPTPTPDTSIPGGPANNVGLTPGPASIAAFRKAKLASLGKQIKGDLDCIVMKALQKDRDMRCQTANGLATDLNRYLADEPVAACPPSVRYRLQKFVRRNKGPVLAACSVLLALVAGIIGTTWGMVRARSAQGIAVTETKQKEAALAAVLKSERDATDQLFLALLNRARAGRFSRQMGQRLDSLNALHQAARIRSDARLRDEAIAAMALPDVRLVPAGRAVPAGTAVVAYDGQHQLHSRVDARGIISIRRLPDDQEVRRIASGTVPNYLCFSPDGRFLLGRGEGNSLCLWRVADGQQVLRDQPRGFWAHAFSPDSRRLAVGQQAWVLCFDPATGQELKRWLLPRRATSLAFHPRDGRLAVGCYLSKVASVYDAASGALLTNLPVGEMRNQAVAWHPDGQRLAVAGSDPRIQIWNVAQKRQLATLEGHVQNVSDLTFHPAGDLLASHGWDGQLLLWHPSSGRRLMSLTFVNDGCPARFSADGRWLGFLWDGARADLLEVTPSLEYRTLVGSAGTVGISSWYGDFSLDGRLLAVSMDEGTRLWDLCSGRELVALPAGTNYVSFEHTAVRERGPVTPDSPPWGLLTGGRDGLLRWPVTSDDPDGKRLRLGPPRQLSPLRRAWFGRGQDGCTRLAVTEVGGPNKILDPETGTVRRELGIHPEGEVQALSGDGRWAASCGWHSDRVRLWNARTVQMVYEWALGKQTLVFFSPDSRTLIIARGDAFSFWDVETLRLIRRLRRGVAQFPGWVAFSPDSRLMALEIAPAVIHLKEAATGRTVAKLEDPHGDRATWQGFTPDGTQLAVLAAHTHAIHIWDLRAIRTRLKGMSLDWDWPDFPPAATAGTAAEPLMIEAVAGDVVESARRELQAHPDSAQACNNLAWLLLTAPERLRDVEAALLLAEKAVRLAAENADFRNTLGAAYYRAGRYRQAVEVLRPNFERQADVALAFDLYFLAMSCHRLGETARARDYYNWAVRWVPMQRELDRGHLEELAAIRAEAEQILRIERK
jgi:serine/threonine protein kinase/WD40 repeat protein